MRRSRFRQASRLTTFASQDVCEGCGAQSSDLSSAGYCPDCQSDLYESESREAVIRPEATLDLWNLKTAVDEQASMGACTKCGDLYAPESFDEGLCPECEYARDWFDDQAIEGRHEGSITNLRKDGDDYTATCECGNTLYCDPPEYYDDDPYGIWYACSQCGLDGWLGEGEFKTASRKTAVNDIHTVDCLDCGWSTNDSDTINTADYKNECPDCGSDDLEFLALSNNGVTLVPTERRLATRKTAAHWELRGLESAWYLDSDRSEAYAKLTDMHELIGDLDQTRWAWQVWNSNFDEVAYGYEDEMIHAQVAAEKALSEIEGYDVYDPYYEASRKTATPMPTCKRCGWAQAAPDITNRDRDSEYCFGCQSDIMREEEDYAEDYGWDGDYGYEDYEPSPYDGTYSEAKRKTAETGIVDLTLSPDGYSTRCDHCGVNWTTEGRFWCDECIAAREAREAARKTAAPVKFPSKCKVCGDSIAVGQGDVRKVNGAWYTTCDAHKPAPKARRSYEPRKVTMTNGSTTIQVDPDDVHDAKRDGFWQV